ncbi:MAG TPA: response regulator [Opitutus sp.]|nr:response regulator [Opitutus sp.]
MSIVSATPLRLLIVEDKPLDAELVTNELERGGFAVAATRVETAEDFERELNTSPDLILCDYTMPHFSAPEALQRLHARHLDIPFIIVTGSIGEETAVAAIKSGADDYLLKDRLARLGAAVSQALEEKQLRAAAHRAEENLRESEFKYRYLFEHLPDAACLCDSRTGKIIDVNERGERLLGLERAAVLGSRLAKFLPESACRSLLATTGDAGRSASENASDITAADGRRVAVRISAATVEIHRRRLLLAFFREANR